MLAVIIYYSYINNEAINIIATETRVLKGQSYNTDSPMATSPPCVLVRIEHVMAKSDLVLFW